MLENYPTYMAIDSAGVRKIARDAGFDLVGIALPQPDLDFDRYQRWISAGNQGAMGYLADHRAEVRRDPRNVLDSCRSVIVLGTLYNTQQPLSTDFSDQEKGWISRYAWGQDYHDVLRERLHQLAARIATEHGKFEWKACVDAAPLLERSYARMAGLGWIGKNTCLINQQQGSWFFLSELVTDLALEPDAPPPDRCGSCTRCIDACPTKAIVPESDWFTVDSRLCISYWTIEHRGPWPDSMKKQVGNHVFGCDICQDVCPWNRQAPFTSDPAFQPTFGEPGIDLERMAKLSEDEFRRMFRPTPISRTKYHGFLRNIITVMVNQPQPRYFSILKRLAATADAPIAETAAWAMQHFPR